MERIDTVLNGLDEVRKSPNFRQHGLSVQIQDNGTIILKAKKIKEYHSEQLTMKDSKDVIKLLKMAVADKKNEKPQDHRSD
jgi:hypothetical protein